MLAPPWGVRAPSWGKSWIRHCPLTRPLIRYCEYTESGTRNCSEIRFHPKQWNKSRMYLRMANDLLWINSKNSTVHIFLHHSNQESLWNSCVRGGGLFHKWTSLGLKIMRYHTCMSKNIPHYSGRHFGLELVWNNKGPMMSVPRHLIGQIQLGCDWFCECRTFNSEG